MTGIPNILTSAQTVLQDGFDRLNKAAVQIVGGALQNTQAPADGTGSPAGTGDIANLRPQLSDTPIGADPIASGLVESIRAQVEISAGAALVHAYSRSMDDLFNMLNPERRCGNHD